MKKTKYPLADVIAESESSSKALPLDKLIDIGVSGSSNARPEVRSCGNLMNHGYYLNILYDWTIVEDDRGAIVLVPQLK